jgi:hypothetical protein
MPKLELDAVSRMRQASRRERFIAIVLRDLAETGRGTRLRVARARRPGEASERPCDKIEEREL